MVSLAKIEKITLILAYLQGYLAIFDILKLLHTPLTKHVWWGVKFLEEFFFKCEILQIFRKNSKIFGQ